MFLVRVVFNLIGLTLLKMQPNTKFKFSRLLKMFNTLYWLQSVPLKCIKIHSNGFRFYLLRKTFLCSTQTLNFFLGVNDIEQFA